MSKSLLTQFYIWQCVLKFKILPSVSLSHYFKSGHPVAGQANSPEPDSLVLPLPSRMVTLKRGGNPSEDERGSSQNGSCLPTTGILLKVRLDNLKVVKSLNTPCLDAFRPFEYREPCFKSVKMHPL